jgi:hypothetical protein
MGPYGSNFQYGYSQYKDDGTAVNTILLHYYALKKIFPVKNLVGELDNDLMIEGRYLDNCYFQGNDLETEIFPDTATNGDMTRSFERLFDTTNMAQVASKYEDLVNKDRKLNPATYIQDASAFGYNSSIYEGYHDMFVIDYNTLVATHLPGQLWDSGRNWTWIMDSTGSIVPSDRTSLMQAIIPRAPAFTKVEFNFA